MKKITIKAETLKAVNDSLALFASGENAVKFEFGIEDKSQADHEDEICACATLVNGGMQVKKCFYANIPEDYEQGLYCTFYVKAEDFLTYTNALLSFNEEICIEVEENLTLRIGEKACVPMELVAEDKADTLLPEEYQKAVVALTLQTDKFLSFARKGCYLYDDKDARNIMDRVKIAIDGTAIHGYSTNGYVIAESWLTDCKVKFLEQNLAMLFLSKKKDALTGEEKETFKKSVKEALDNNKLLEYAKNEGIELDKFDFSLLFPSFQTLKKVVSGTKMFQLAVTDSYCYVNTGSIMATFTLGAVVPTVYEKTTAFQQIPESAKVVVDCATLTKGVSLLNLDGEVKQPVCLTISGEELSLSKGEASVNIPLIEKQLSENVEIYLSGTYLKLTLSSLDSGNVCITIRNAATPIEIRNGALSDKSDSSTFVLLVKKNA